MQRYIQYLLILNCFVVYSPGLLKLSWSDLHRTLTKIFTSPSFFLLLTYHTPHKSKVFRDLDQTARYWALRVSRHCKNRRIHQCVFNPCKCIFMCLIKYGLLLFIYLFTTLITHWSSNLKVATFDIEIMCSKNIHTIVPISWKLLPLCWRWYIFNQNKIGILVTVRITTL